MKSYLISRRDLIKQFGFAAFLLHPLLRSAANAASSPFAGAPRFIMLFKGASFQPTQMPTSFSNFAGTPLASLEAHKNDFILFKNMHTTGGKVQSSSYQEEHGGGLYGCVTGNSLKYTKNDAYYSYTDFESIDMRIAREYQSRAALSSLPFASLHIGGGAHSDADNVGVGNRYISFRNRQNGDTTYGNAIVPVQNAGQIYDSLMSRINLICSAGSNQPIADNAAMRSALERKKSILDLKLKDIQDAKNKLGLGSEHSRKLDGLLEGWRESEKLVVDQLAALGTSGGGKNCPTGARPTAFEGSSEDEKQNLDKLSPLHDQMISMTKLAFQWDLTRVVAFTLSGASCGQYIPSRGVTKYHHGLEHGSSASDMSQLAIVDAYYAEKFASLLAALKSIDDGGGQTGLYNSTVMFGMECWSSKNQHSLLNIPYMLGGQGAGKFQSGRIVDAQGRSNNDLLLSCLAASGVNATSFGVASLCKGPIV